MRQRRDKRGDVDQAWDRMVERLDGVDADPRELARVEEILGRDGEDVVAPQWIEATVQEATKPPATVVPFRGFWQLSRVAAVLALLLVLVAGIGVLVLWPDKPRSKESMLYSEAASIVLDSGRPVDVRQLALMRIVELAIAGVETLKAVLVEDAAPDDLRNLVEQELGNLRGLVRVANPPQPEPIKDDIIELRSDALDPSPLVEEERPLRVMRIARASRNAILLIRAVPPGDPTLDADRENYLLSIAGLLR